MAARAVIVESPGEALPEAKTFSNPTGIIHLKVLVSTMYVV
jgi:hypothetical protein